MMICVTAVTVTATSGVEDKMQKGDVVVFGRPNGEKTEAVVVKVNRKTVVVETIEARGTLRPREAGRKWRVPNDPRFITVTLAGADAVTRLTEARQRLAAEAASVEVAPRPPSGDAWFDRWFPHR